MIALSNFIEALDLSVLLFSYSVVITLLLAFWIWRRKRIKSHYNNWKKEKVNLFGIYAIEFERNEDKFLEELFEELEAKNLELKLLRKEYNKVGIYLLIILVPVLIASLFSRNKNEAQE